MFGRLYHLPERTVRRRADEPLERFGLSDAAERMVRTYSGGMRRRLDLAASLIIAPAVLFLDEPTTGLDPRSRNEVWDAIRIGMVIMAVIGLLVGSRAHDGVASTLGAFGLILLLRYAVSWAGVYVGLSARRYQTAGR